MSISFFPTLTGGNEVSQHEYFIRSYFVFSPLLLYFLVSLGYFEVYRVCPLRCESAIIEIFHALSDLLPSLKLLSVI